MRASKPPPRPWQPLLTEAAVHSVALGPTVSRASGLAFWCPATAGSLKADIETYAHLAFDQKTGWSRYLEARFMASCAVRRRARRVLLQ